MDLSQAIECASAMTFPGFLVDDASLAGGGSVLVGKADQRAMFGENRRRDGRGSRQREKKAEDDKEAAKAGFQDWGENVPHGNRL